MTRGADFGRFLLFCIFFSVGAGAIGVSMLAGEFQTLLDNKRIYQETLETNKKIISLIEQYNLQSEQIKNNPQLLQRLQRYTFGDIDKPEEDGQYPKAQLEQLAQARETLMDDMNSPTAHPSRMEKWVVRAAEPNNRLRLFLAGTGLVLITFIFFGTNTAEPEKSAEKTG